MNRDQIKDYIHICREANIPPRATLNALMKKAGLKKEASSSLKFITSTATSGAAAKGASKATGDIYEGLKLILGSALGAAKKGANALKPSPSPNAAKFLDGAKLMRDGAWGATKTGLKVGVPLAGGYAWGSYATADAKDQQMAEAKKDFEKVVTNLTDRSKKQQEDWLLRGGAAGASLGSILAPLLLRGKNPVLSSLLGATLGAVGGSVGGSLYSNYLGNNNNESN